MSYLRLKRRRDIGRQRWQFVAVLVTIGLGVMLFAATYDAYRNLEASYNRTYERLGFADITVVGLGDEFAIAAAEIDGVAVVETRRQADLPFRIDDEVVFGRVIEMPAPDQPDINRIDVTAGDYLDPDDPTSAVAESHLVTDHELAPGDTVEVLIGDRLAEVTIDGEAVSAEYIWPARSRQEIFPLPGTFGVLFVNEVVLDDVAESAVTREVVVLYEPGADRDATDTAVIEAATAAGAADAIPQAQQASNETLQLDVKGFEQLSIMFPALFMVAAGLAAFVLLNRIVFLQRPQIGTMRASGMGRRTLNRHYLSYGLLLGGGGAAAGVVLGMAAGWASTALYTDALGIPDAVREFHLVTPIVGLAFGLVTGALAALAPARSASSMSPAEAMRGEVTTVAGSRSPLERVLPFLSRLPVRWLMVVRGLTRSKRRSASTIIGVVLALTLVMVSWGMIDTMRSVIDRQFDEVALEDATAVIAGPVDHAAVGQVAAVPGVAAAEAVVALPAAVNAGDAGYSTELQAYGPDTAMHGFPNGLSAGGVVAGAPLAGELGVDIGDTVTVSLPTLDGSFDAVIDGFVDEPIGTYLYMGRAGLEAALASAHPVVDVDALTAPTVSTVKIQVVDDADRSQVIDGIDELSTVAAVIDDRELVELVEDMLVFFYVFIGLMLVFGGTMAFALIFNTISVNVAERSGEYATMRANGIGNGRIARLIAGENLMLTSLGIGPGIIVGYLAGRWFMQQYSSDLFTLSFDMRPVSIAACAVAMLVVALLSLIPAIRVVRGLDIGLVVRERSL